tara:strand:+ start:90 stop:299 length:210 start_codon:yes stop_codon:yes gene_type:complete
MKHLSSNKKPVSAGWYLWWSEQEDKSPFHVLAKVKNSSIGLIVNFSWDKSIDDWSPIDSVADRLWLKVS